MNVRAHWLDNDFTPHDKCFTIKPVPRSHSAHFITSQLNDVIAEFSLDRNGLHVVGNGGDSMKEAVSQVVDLLSY